jgi:hypothetical protein
MQIDLMEPLVVDSMKQDGRACEYGARAPRSSRELTAPQPRSAQDHHGLLPRQPTDREEPAWQGGFSWAKDSLGRPWVVTTDQGMGASVWWPNKDTQADEPDSQRVALTVPDPLINVSNGRLRSTKKNANGTRRTSGSS